MPLPILRYNFFDITLSRGPENEEFTLQDNQAIVRASNGLIYAYDFGEDLYVITQSFTGMTQQDLNNVKLHISNVNKSVEAWTYVDGRGDEYLVRFGEEKFTWRPTSNGLYSFTLTLYTQPAGGEGGGGNGGEF